MLYIYIFKVEIYPMKKNAITAQTNLIKQLLQQSSIHDN